MNYVFVKNLLESSMISILNLSLGLSRSLSISFRRLGVEVRYSYAINICDLVFSL